MKENVYLIGIGGAGLSAIATVLLQQGFRVAGSDMQVSPATDRLSRLGATVNIGHRAENLNVEPRPDVVVVSSAIGPDNPELVEARRRGLPVKKRADWLGYMMQDKVGIAIAGSHGKTTTTAMTAFVLQEAGQSPTFIVGGFIPQLGTNAAAGSSNLFVIEADEYDYMFLGLRPEIAVITTVEWDHPDIFPTPQRLVQAFEEFVQLVPAHGLVIGCGDDPGARAVIQKSPAQVMTYGLEPGNDWQAVDLRPNPRGGLDFNVVDHQAGTGGQQNLPAPVSLAVPGRHNVCNALAALLLARQRQVDLALAAGILARYQGVNRRFEVKGEINGITIIDDYAHHPTEVKTTLKAARSRFPQQQIWAVFQPHTFSRTLALLNDFAAAFEMADHVIVLDIFASREKDEGLVTAGDLVKAMRHPHARYIGPLNEAADYLLAHLAAPAVLLTMGAGDGYQVGEWVLQKLRSRHGLSGAG